MAVKNKLGTYIENLMCVIVDVEKEQDDFVKELAWNELKRLNVDVSNFLSKHKVDDSKDKEKTIKKLLQEKMLVSIRH